MSANAGAVASPSGLHRNGRPVTDWPSIRLWVLDRGQYWCQICQLRGASDVDHIWPRRLGGDDHIDNLRAACGPCNRGKGDRIDLGSATDDQILIGRFTLQNRIDALEAEVAQFENEVLARIVRRGNDLRPQLDATLCGLRDRIGRDELLAVEITWRLDALAAVTTGASS